MGLHILITGGGGYLKIQNSLYKCANINNGQFKIISFERKTVVAWLCARAVDRKTVNRKRNSIYCPVTV